MGNWLELGFGFDDVTASLASAQEASEPIRASARMVMSNCDTDKDGMVSKQEFMKHMEKMFDKMDNKKMGKLDTKQVEMLLADLMKAGA